MQNNLQVGSTPSLPTTSSKHIIKMDKPIISKRISAGTRVYYIDAHTDRKGQPYISISEIPTDKSPGKKKRQRIFLHAENVDQFAQAFAEVANHIKNDTQG